MATINLAPGTQYLAAIRRRRRIIFGLAAVLMVVVGLVWTVAFLVEQNALKEKQQVDAELAAAKTAIAERAQDVERITLFENRLQAVEKLLAQHPQSTLLLKELERLLPVPTVLTSTILNLEEGKVEMNGLTPNMDEVALAIASLSSQEGRSTLFTEANLDNITRREAKGADGAVVGVEYVFHATLMFNPQELLSVVP